jgi:predicted glycoside hydrolase/deacetylase ChbG (UPF0249 family)
MAEPAKLLIVNADDLGMTRGVNRAIIEAHRGGIVTSTSVLANGAAFEDAAAWLRQSPGLSVGLHLNLTQGKPIAASAKSALLDRGGCFQRPAMLALRLSIGAISVPDLEVEIAAQAERIVRAGIAITHFDSHENVHLHPRVASAMLNVARRMDVRWIRFRDQRPLLPPLLREAGLLRLRDHGRHLLAMLGARFAASGAETVQPPRWIVGAPQLLHASARQVLGALVQLMEDGVTEWVCHPGYADDELRAMLDASGAQRRADELTLLTDKGCKPRLDAAGITLVNYAQLAG